MLHNGDRTFVTRTLVARTEGEDSCDTIGGTHTRSTEDSGDVFLYRRYTQVYQKDNSDLLTHCIMFYL